MSKCELSELMPNGTFSLPTFFLPVKREGIKWNGNATKSQDMVFFHSTHSNLLLKPQASLRTVPAFHFETNSVLQGECCSGSTLY